MCATSVFLVNVSINGERKAHDDKKKHIMCDGNKLSCFVCDRLTVERKFYNSVQLHIADFNGMSISFWGGGNRNDLDAMSRLRNVRKMSVAN